MDDSSENLPIFRLGEIVETSTVGLWAESDELHRLPELGSVVRTSSAAGDAIYAIVAFGQTAGIDQTRRAVRRGSSELQDDAVYRRHPELSQILRTTFEAIPVAFRHEGRIIRSLPPLPAPLHYSISSISEADLRELTDDLRYLPLLARYQGTVSAEQLIAAHLRATFAARGFEHGWLEGAASEVSRLFRREYDRLLPILEAIDPGV